jgi:flavin reductase (DIM6/NTAB) family NADH-FMN oxidoreductase RutF
MELDFASLAPAERYKVLTATIVPRPIAWVTTVSADGVRNAAPFSFFNALGKAPPLIALGIQGNDDGSRKDTARNIAETGEFVVNLVTEATVEAMSATSVAAPPDVDELALAGIGVAPSLRVKPPRIAASPVAFECRLHTPLAFPSGQFIVIGEVLHAHIADTVVADAGRLYVDTLKMRPVGRMQGRTAYVRTRDTFDVARPGAGAKLGVAWPET